MKLPVDVSEFRFLVAVPPAPVMDFETKRQRADENGELLHTVQLVCLSDGNADILAVKFAGQPGLLAQGTPVKVSGLVATPWSMGERAGVAYKALRVEALAPVHAGNGSADKGR
jgi:hypothetical protein